MYQSLRHLQLNPPTKNSHTFSTTGFRLMLRMFSDVGILSQFKADWAEQLLIVSFVIGTKYYMDFLIQ